MKRHPKVVGMLVLAGVFFVFAGSEASAKKDRDNNPPGPKGGPGTNWENPPGPQGGPGAGPDKPGRALGLRAGKHWEEWLAKHPQLASDIDINKDGVVDDNEKASAAVKFNYLNPPGSEIGAPGAPPALKDPDHNPPGPAGGPGTNWENPPGPQGGPGASPDKKPKK